MNQMQEIYGRQENLIEESPSPVLPQSNQNPNSVPDSNETYIEQPTLKYPGICNLCYFQNHPTIQCPFATTFYHATNKNTLNSIIQNGLNPTKGRLGQAVYVSDDPAMCIKYSFKNSRKFSQPILLKLKVMMNGFIRKIASPHGKNEITYNYMKKQNLQALKCPYFVIKGETLYEYALIEPQCVILSWRPIIQQDIYHKEINIYPPRTIDQFFARKITASRNASLFGDHQNIVTESVSQQSHKQTLDMMNSMIESMIQYKGKIKRKVAQNFQKGTFKSKENQENQEKHKILFEQTFHDGQVKIDTIPNDSKDIQNQLNQNQIQLEPSMIKSSPIAPEKQLNINSESFSDDNSPGQQQNEQQNEQLAIKQSSKKYLQQKDIEIQKNEILKTKHIQKAHKQSRNNRLASLSKRLDSYRKRLTDTLQKILQEI